MLYKCHVLPVLEFPTPAVFHASTGVVELLDKVQKRFLRELQLSEEEALLRFNLAPLSCRRDIAILGLIHRTVLKQGPSHFQKWFFPRSGQPSYATRLQEHRHDKQLHDYLQGSHSELLRRSPLGQVRVYNQLPQEAVNASTVKLFQRRLQKTLKLNLEKQNCALQRYGDYGGSPWQLTYSVRTR